MFFTCRVKYQTLRADNATNILGSKNQLKELNQTVFPRHALEKVLISSLFPLRAPHFGGLWEAAVNSEKQLLPHTQVVHP